MRYITLFLLILPVVLFAQEPPRTNSGRLNVRGDAYASNQRPAGTVVHASVLHGDTIPMIQLPEIKIASNRVWASQADQKKWERLKKKVKKVYPYALLARVKMEALEMEMTGLDRKKDKKEFIKKAEKEIFSEFEDEIKDMTVSEGIILIKLIDRETGESSFELVKELKGSFNAFMWQSVARIFGHNLKTKYDPRGEDYMIEEIVLMIKRGDL